MESNVSTVAFRSNLYPYDDGGFNSVFRTKIHDPFSLEILKRTRVLTPLQKQEYQYASLHCAYAAKDDYPWGTIKDMDGQERVVCKCLNTSCTRFKRCRPDFDPAELAV